MHFGCEYDDFILSVGCIGHVTYFRYLLDVTIQSVSHGSWLYVTRWTVTVLFTLSTCFHATS